MRITGIFQNYTRNLNFNGQNKCTNAEFYKTPASNVYDVFTKQINPKPKACKNCGIHKERMADGWIRYCDGSVILSKDERNWEKAPQIDLQKNEDNKTIVLYATPYIMAENNTDRENGGYCLNITNKDGTFVSSALYITPRGEFYCEQQNDTNSTRLKDALYELLDIISSDKYKDVFGNSADFNNRTKEAIRYIENSTKQPV